jgi:hypothetical protein
MLNLPRSASDSASAGSVMRRANVLEIVREDGYMPSRPQKQASKRACLILYVNSPLSFTKADGLLNVEILMSQHSILHDSWRRHVKRDLGRRGRVCLETSSRLSAGSKHKAALSQMLKTS